MPDSLQTLLAHQETMASDLVEVKVSIARMEQKLTSMCSSQSSERDTMREERSVCRAGFDGRIVRLENRTDAIEQQMTADIETLEGKFATLLTWGKAIAIVGSIGAATLIILNILQAVGY